MDKQLIDKIENLFDKYGVKSKKKVNLERPFITVESYEVELNNGERIYRDKLIKNGGTGSACIIVPITKEGKVVTVIQPRVFSKKGVLMDFPAGYIESYESIIEAAKRELEEETGCVGDSYELLTTYYQDEGASEARVSIVLARNVKRVKELNLDKDEYLEPLEISIDDLDECVKREYIASGGCELAINLLKVLKYEGKL